MSTEWALVTEIEMQLDDDLLYFGWLLQIVQTQNPDSTELERIASVLDAVMYLHQRKTVVVGDAIQTAGMVCIRPWPESDERLRAKLELTINDASAGDRNFCFWIQLARHFAA